MGGGEANLNLEEVIPCPGISSYLSTVGRELAGNLHILISSVSGAEICGPVVFGWAGVATVTPADSLKSVLSTGKFKRLWSCKAQFQAHSPANRWETDSTGDQALQFLRHH